MYTLYVINVTHGRKNEKSCGDEAIKRLKLYDKMNIVCCNVICTGSRIWNWQRLL